MNYNRGPIPVGYSEYMGPQYEYGPTTTFEEERTIMVDDLKGYIEWMNEPRVDLQIISNGILLSSQEIRSILIPKGLSQGQIGDNVIPSCFEERCTKVAVELEDCSKEFLLSPNLAQSISYAVEGLMYLVATLSICDCFHCDDYCSEMELKLTVHARKMSKTENLATISLTQIFKEIRSTFQNLRWGPSGCGCHRCVARMRII